MWKFYWKKGKAVSGPLSSAFCLSHTKWVPEALGLLPGLLSSYRGSSLRHTSSAIVTRDCRSPGGPGETSLTLKEAKGQAVWGGEKRILEGPAHHSTAAREGLVLLSQQCSNSVWQRSSGGAALLHSWLLARLSTLSWAWHLFLTNFRCAFLVFSITGL